MPSVPCARLLALAVPLSVAFPCHAQTALRTVQVASGLNQPVGVYAAPGDESRLFVLEQNTGLVRLVRNGVVQPTPFATVAGQIRTGNESGLLGLAFHPRYSQNGFFYLYWTRASDGFPMIVRYQVSATNPDQFDPSSAFTILGPIAKPWLDHNAGCLRFGPDGNLWIGVGDGGVGVPNEIPDPNCNAQRTDTLLGKILRLDVDSGSPYAIPGDNPFVNVPGTRGEIWAYGLRNPWRFSFDRLTADLWIGDVGHDTREEIDFQAAATPGGLNFGWKPMEGTNCFNTANCLASIPPCNDPRYTLPLHEYPHTIGCAVIGGFVYRGCAIPDLGGTFFYGDFCAHKVWSFRRQGGQVTDLRDRTAELQPAGRPLNAITAFGEDARGELLICDYSGYIWKVVANAPAPAVDLGYAKLGGNGRYPRFDACGVLTAGNGALMRLIDAPATTVAFLALSDQNNPTPVFSGILVPVPPLVIPVLITGPDGALTFTVPGGGGPATAYGQFLIYDPLATESVGFSNALAITLQS